MHIYPVDDKRYVVIPHVVSFLPFKYSDGKGLLTVGYAGRTENFTFESFEIAEHHALRIADLINKYWSKHESCE